MLECRNSELPGTASKVADWPLDFKGLKKKLMDRDSFRQIQLAYTNSNFLQWAARKESLPEQDKYGTKEKSRRSKCNEFRLPGTVSRVTAWPLDFKGLKTSGKRFS